LNCKETLDFSIGKRLFNKNIAILLSKLVCRSLTMCYFITQQLTTGI